MPNRTLWIALSLADHVGSKTLNALFEHFGDHPQAILSADTAELQQVPGVGPKIASSIQAVNMAHVGAALDDWVNADIAIATAICSDSPYPPSLLSLDDPPATLFMRGTWRAEDQRAVAVVGTREPSPQAVALTREIAARLAERGITVVSGLALGIDAAAHVGALSVPAGRTIAVLGCGVLNIYPRRNHELALACLRRGVVLSEVNPALPPSAPRLVARNRIISGLSRAVIVVETSVDGGAMHAARFAQQQGRAVLTFDLDASGNRELLAGGAGLLEPDGHNLDDLLEPLLRD